MNKLLYFSKNILTELDIRSIDLIKSIENLLKSYQETKAWNIPKTIIDIGNNKMFMTMTATLTDGFTSVKSLAFNPQNTPSINALITLFDSSSGLPIAIMDGAWITAYRTAGLSAFVAKKIANPNSRVIAFIGCGIQATSHLEVFSELFPLCELRAFSRGSKNKNKLYTKAIEKGISIIENTDLKETISGADIVISTVPESPDLIPFLDQSWLKAGAFVSMVDIGRSWLPENMELIDEIIIDDLKQEQKMDISMVDLNLVSGDLLSLLNTAERQHFNKNKRKAFIFRGMALGDLALSSLVYEEALKKSLGIQLNR